MLDTCPLYIHIPRSRFSMVRLVVVQKNGVMSWQKNPFLTHHNNVHAKHLRRSLQATTPPLTWHKRHCSLPAKNIQISTLRTTWPDSTTWHNKCEEYLGYPQLKQRSLLNFRQSVCLKL